MAASSFNGSHIPNFLNRRIIPVLIPPVYLHFYYFLSLLLLIHSGNYGQTNGVKYDNAPGMKNSSIYQVFDKEMKKYHSPFLDTARRIPVLSILPSWIGNIASQGPDNLIVLGISDPGLPDSVAKTQAMNRACAMAALSQKTSSRFFSDSFLKNRNEASGSKYAEIYHFMSSSPISVRNCRVLHDTVLKSKETVLLVAFPAIPDSSPDDEFLNVQGYLYNDEFEVDSRNRWLKRIETIVSAKDRTKSDWETDSLSFYQVNQRFTGIKNGQQKFIPEYNRFEYFYISESNGSARKDSLEKKQASSCKTGLWIAFLNQVYDQLSYFVKTHATQTQVVSDQTNDARIDLNREKHRESLKFTFSKFDLTDNKLVVQINITHEK